MEQCWAHDPDDRPSFEFVVLKLREMLDTELQLTTNSPQATANEADLSVVEDPQIPIQNQSDSEEEDLSGKFWHIDFSELEYDTNDLLGSGRSSNVYKGLFRNQEVAIKVFKMNLEGQELADFKKELDMLSRIRYLQNNRLF